MKFHLENCRKKIQRLILDSKGYLWWIYCFTCR